MDKLLVVEGLKKHFPIHKGIFSSSGGSVKAVDGVSFSLKRGETLALVGESGCGKSTVGKTILQLYPATGGRVSFRGEELFSIEDGRKISKEKLLELRRSMQIIFQDPYACLDPRMTIQDIVTEGIKKHEKLSISERRERAIELLRDCGMGEESLLKYPHQFSGGQRQRIGIARALSLNPEFIVCDEPTAALDVSIQSQILNLMLKLKEERGLSYLFISHDLNIVRDFSNKICVMYLGRVVEWAPAKTLFKHPLHPYTKGLLASVPQFEAGRRRVEIVLKGELPSPSNPPKGCLFHTRCPYARDVCLEVPPLEKVENDHYVACRRLEEIS